MRRKDASFNVINSEQGFYAFQYFIHEVFEICFLISKKLNPWERDKLEKDNKKVFDWCHAKALEAEYLFLKQTAESLGYSISLGSIFDKHPLFSTEERQLTKDNDKKLLSQIGVDIISVPSEFEDAKMFYKELGQL